MTRLLTSLPSGSNRTPAGKFCCPDLQIAEPTRLWCNSYGLTLFPCPLPTRGTTRISCKTLRPLRRECPALGRRRGPHLTRAGAAKAAPPRPRLPPVVRPALDPGGWRPRADRPQTAPVAASTFSGGDATATMGGTGPRCRAPPDPRGRRRVCAVGAMMARRFGCPLASVAGQGFRHVDRFELSLGNSTNAAEPSSARCDSDSRRI